MAAEQWLKIRVTLRKGALREERILWMNNRLVVHLLKISPHGAQSHHPRSREGIVRLPEGIGGGHKLPQGNLNLILMHRRTQRVSEPRLEGGGRILPRPPPLPQYGLEMRKIVKNFSRDDPSLCLTTTICRGINNEVNVKLGTRNQEVRKEVMSCREVAEGILR